MSTKRIHQAISFGSLLKFLIGLALLVQVIVITYNHYSGRYLISDLENPLMRLSRGVFLSLLAGFMTAYPDLLVIRFLDHVAGWGQHTLRRILLQICLALLVAVGASVLMTLFENLLEPYSEDFIRVLVSNALIYSTVNIVIMAILEGWIIFIERGRVRQMAENLQAELSQIRFEVLKSQINPHFMFNSLNVLSGLINKDPHKAHQFIDEFSMVYRHVLETIEQPVASLRKELDFARSYLFLQQIRYGDDLTYSVNIPSEMLDSFLPPLSLQVILENTTKHNIVNKSNPLYVEIFYEDPCLVVRNNIQPKISKSLSTGLGLKNLRKRYALIGSAIPSFTLETKHYVARLPLINHE